MAAVVQSTSAQAVSSSATAITATLPNPSASGNLIVVIGVDGLTGTSEATTPVSDSGGHAWSVAVGIVFFGATRNIQRYAKNVTGQTTHTFTYTAPSTGGFPSIAVVEISFADTVAPFDISTSNGNGVASANPHGTGTTGALATADEIAVAGMTHTGGSNEAFASAQGFTIQESQPNTSSMPIVLSTKVLVSSGGLQEQYNLTPNSSVIWTANIGVYVGVPETLAFSMEGFARLSPRP